MDKETRPAIRHYKELSSFERISIYLKEGRKKSVQLTADEKRQLEIYKTAFGLLLEHNGDERTVRSKLGEFSDIVESTCYVYIRECKELFFDPALFNAKAELHFTLQQTNELISKADKAGDYAAAARLIKVKTEIIKKLDSDGLSKLWDQIQPGKIILGHFPETLNVILPPEDELRKEIEKLKQVKRKKDLFITDAEIIPPDEEGPL